MRTERDSLVAALVAALEAFAPEDPFVGDELSGGPACVGCCRDRHNANHNLNSDSSCRWVRARFALEAAKSKT